MEYQKITNLLGNIPDKVPKLLSKKWIKLHDQSSNADDRYKPKKQIRFKTSMLQSDLCNCRNVCSAVKGTITVTGANNRDNRPLVFKSNDPFISCISKINNVLTDNAKYLDVVMPMYSLIEYSKSYKKTTGSLWNYYRDEPNNPLADNYNADLITNSASFKHKSSVIGKIRKTMIIIK